jgi:fimbrial chaperone protein
LNAVIGFFLGLRAAVASQLLLLAAAPSAIAQVPPAPGGLSVAPVQLSLSDTSRSVSTIVSNPGGAPITVQARLYAWKMNGEEEAYEPATDAGFSPPLFKLAPSRTQAVRVVAKTPPGPVERSYRLVVDQLPLADAPGQLQLPVRMVLPVFVEPAAGVARTAKLDWRARYEPQARQIRLSVANRGAVHARIVDLAVESAGKSATVAAGLAGYALAGGERDWTYRADTAPDTLTIVATNGAAPVRVTVPVTR